MGALVQPRHRTDAETWGCRGRCGGCGELSSTGGGRLPRGIYSSIKVHAILKIDTVWVGIRLLGAHPVGVALGRGKALGLTWVVVVGEHWSRRSPEPGWAQHRMRAMADNTMITVLPCSSA